MSKYKTAIGITFAIFLAVVPVAIARLVEDWPYEKLFRNSDIVIVARAVKTEPAVDRLAEASRKDLEFAGQNTTFAVEYVLKGQVEDKQITMLHFRIVTSRDFIIDPPLLATFIARRPMEYLLFLKRMKDGRYEPVSGQIDPVFSVRMVVIPFDVASQSIDKSNTVGEPVKD